MELYKSILLQYKTQINELVERKKEINGNKNTSNIFLKDASTIYKRHRVRTEDDFLQNFYSNMKFLYKLQADISFKQSVSQEYISNNRHNMKNKLFNSNRNITPVKTASKLKKLAALSGSGSYHDHNDDADGSSTHDHDLLAGILKENTKLKILNKPPTGASPLKILMGNLFHTKDLNTN